MYNFSIVDVFLLAKEVSEVLDVEQQLWLISWWQQHLWMQRRDVRTLRHLDQLQRNLLGLVQPRLAWEVALLQLINVCD